MRGLRAAPGFAFVAVATLALGIGAATAIFSVVHAVLLRPIYPDGERLVRVWETHGVGNDRNVVSRGNFLDWMERSRTLESLGAFMADFGYGLTGDGNPVQVTGSLLSPGVLDVLGVAPVIGRGFEPGLTGAEDEVLLSYGLWRDRFGGDPSVLGRRIVLDDEAYVVIGVMPAEFAFPTHATQVWMPMRFSAADRSSRDAHMLQVVARLAPGETVESAHAEMVRIADGIRREHPEPMENYSARVVAFRADLTASVKPLVLLLLGAVALVLLIACVNVANLLLARGARRRTELAVRAALGAGRGRLVRQLLAEHALLAALGGVGGLLLAAALTRAFLAFAPEGVPLLDRARIDGAALGFAVAVSVASVLVFGLVPAIRAAGHELQSVLRSVTAAGDRALARRVLLVAEVTLSVVLLVAAGLLVRSFQRLHAVDPGLEPRGVLVASLNLPAARYPGSAAHASFYDEVLERLRASPGTLGAAGTSEPPVLGFEMMRTIVVDGYVFAPGERDDVHFRAVTPGYFATLRVPIVEGRAFDETDRPGAPPVVIVNETFVQRFWPDGRAVGQRVRLAEDGPWYEVIGVAGDVRQRGLAVTDWPAIYGAYAQKDWTWLTWMTLVVRTAGDPVLSAPALRRAVWDVDPQLPIQDLGTLDDVYRTDAAPRRFTLVIVATFAGLGLLLGAIGIYGVVAYSVASRSREIGVRMALGARRPNVIGMVLADGLRMALVGTVLGTLGAVAAARFMSGLLFGIEPTDPVTFAVVPVLTLLIAAAACLIPARRASRLDPVSTLR
jgi:predicted permease